jgi:hypothetical protein
MLLATGIGAAALDEEPARHDPRELCTVRAVAVLDDGQRLPVGDERPLSVSVSDGTSGPGRRAKLRVQELDHFARFALTGGTIADERR